MNTDTNAQRRPGRRNALALGGIAVLLAFAWLTTTACTDDEDLFHGSGPAGAPPPPPEDQGVYVDMRDDVRVRNDGSMTFVQYSPDLNTSTVLCDSRTGKGSSDKAAQDRMKSSLEGQADWHRREVEAIDKLLKSCEGKAQSTVAILAAHGCSEVQEGKLGGDAYQLNERIEELHKRIRQDEEMLRTIIGREMQLAQSGKSDKAAQAEIQRLKSAIAEDKQQLDWAQQRYAEASAAAQRMQDTCNKARETLGNEPCRDSNLRFNRNRRIDLVAKGAHYKHLAESFKDCVNRIAQSEKPATRRETMDPGTVMQILPGILGSGRPSRPSRSSPPPSHHSD